MTARALFAICFFAVVRNWLTFLPWSLDSFGSGDWVVVFSNIARAVLPLVIVLLFRCRPVGRAAGSVVSGLLVVVLFACTACLLSHDGLNDERRTVLLIALGSACCGWFYNQTGALLSIMSVREACVSAFIGPAVSSACGFVGLSFPQVAHWVVYASLACLSVMLFFFPWHEIAARDERARDDSKPVYASDLARASIPLVLYCVAWGAMNFADPMQAEPAVFGASLASWVFKIAACIACAAFLARKANIRRISSIFKVVIVVSCCGLALETIPSPVCVGLGRFLFMCASYLVPSIWLILTVFTTSVTRFSVYAACAFSTPILLLPLAFGEVLGYSITQMGGYEETFYVCCTILLLLSLSLLTFIDRWLSPYVEEPRSSGRRLGENFEAAYGLSAREGEIAQLLCRGWTYEHCAASLELSVNTVRTYVRRLYRKVEVSCREELMVVMDNFDDKAPRT